MTLVRRNLASLTVGWIVLLAGGCNLLSLPFFIFGPEPKVSAQLHQLAPPDKEKEVKVVVLAVAGLETRSELVRADRELETLLVDTLKAGLKYNQEENVKIVPSSRVQEFKGDHPDWRKWDPEEIAKHFKADYVIWLELGAMSLYEHGSNNTLFRGRSEIDVSLIDVKRDGEAARRKFYTGMYPADGRPAVEASDGNPTAFRRAFLTHVAKEISWYFTAHPTSSNYMAQ